MNKEIKRYTVTAALPYTNGPVHIGHLAGVYVPADVYVRYLRSRGRDVAFICGSDEHGVPITIKAKKEGITPQQVVDKYNKIIKDSFAAFGISFDNYSRTSAAVHHRTASDFFRRLYDEGKFIEETSSQYYDAVAQQFLADRYITGTCPKCGAEGAYGDQCEKCGSTLSPQELIDPKSALSGETPILKETTHWYLPLEKYEDWLREWILEGHKGDWKPNVLGQVKSWLDDGLRPRAVTRDLDWGIPVPVEGAEGKVLYVWFDAPIGYISSTKEWAEREGKDWEPYWKSDDTKLVHFIGKDNIVFHCIIFPSMLRAHGDYILPENVPANEFLNLEGNKLSTSKNWAVWLNEYLEEFPGKQDVLRYALIATAPETKDNDFTWKDFQGRNNSELVAILGNFINRALVLTQKYYGGVVPSGENLTDEDKATLEEMRSYPEKIALSIEKYRFREAAAEMMNLARLGNKYLAENEPWKVVKTDPVRTEAIMYTALQIAASLTTMCEPFVPFAAEKLAQMMNIVAPCWDEVASKEILIPTGHKIGEVSLLFEKIEDEAIDFQLQKLEKARMENIAAAKAKEPAKEIITYDDFAKMDIRVGTILTAEKVAKAKKLLKLTIDTGLDVRTVVSGIAESFSPEDVVGRRVCVLVNLAPREIRGITSNGMILMTEYPDGRLEFVAPTGDVSNGSAIS
ncbi:MAG: methionine--tRNA ligase [Flavobacteriales bacterium]|nr:methionine--tRNA ligase [Flavobacteriales bacterium]